MPVIDIHTHAFPDSLAPRAIAALEAECEWRAVGDGTISALVESMDAADVDVSVVCPICTKPDQAKGVLSWCKSIRNERIDPFPSVHPDTPKPDRWLQRFAKERFVGIKLHPMYQNFALDEERLDPIYSAAADCGLIVEVHCGCDIAFPGDDRASVERLGRVIRRHAKTKFVCTHLGGWKMWDDVWKHVVGTEVWLETSFSLAWQAPAEAEKIIRAHGIERVLFGTDWPWAAQDKQIDLLNSLSLSRQEKDQILFSNAARLLGC